MIGERSTLALIVFLSVVFCAPLGSHVTKIAKTPINPNVAICRSASTMMPLASSETSRHRDVSHFSQFRYRMKSVLGETTDPTVEETDRGPANIPSRLISVSPQELTSRRHPTVHPLRC